MFLAFHFHLRLTTNKSTFEESLFRTIANLDFVYNLLIFCVFIFLSLFFLDGHGNTMFIKYEEVFACLQQYDFAGDVLIGVEFVRLSNSNKQTIAIDC